MYIKNTVINDNFVVFWNSIFSNFLPCDFVFKGLKFKYSEHGLMWCKAIHFGDTKIAEEILVAPTPKKAKELGRLVKNFNEKEWNEVRLQYMLDVLVCKFGQNPSLKKTLLSTGSRKFVEGSPFDIHWGIGIHWQNSDCLDESKWKGQNLLGKALDQTKEILKG